MFPPTGHSTLVSEHQFQTWVKVKIYHPPDEYQVLMQKPTNIRNISVIGPGEQLYISMQPNLNKLRAVDHGKSTLAYSLVSKARFSIPLKMEEIVSEIRIHEKQQFITTGMKSIATPMYFQINEDAINAIKEPSNGYFITFFCSSD